jgi:hypothetical protein
LYLQISLELALPRNKRTSVKAFMKSISEQIQRQNEIQPQIPDAVIKEYNTHFKDEPSTIAKPECVNGLVEIRVSLDDIEVKLPETPRADPSHSNIIITLENENKETKPKEPPKKPAFK